MLFFQHQDDDDTTITRHVFSMFKILLPPSEFINHFKNLEESKYFKINIIKKLEIFMTLIDIKIKI